MHVWERGRLCARLSGCFFSPLCKRWHCGQSPESGITRVRPGWCRHPGTRLVSMAVIVFISRKASSQLSISPSSIHRINRSILLKAAGVVASAAGAGMAVPFTFFFFFFFCCIKWSREAFTHGGMIKCPLLWCKHEGCSRGVVSVMVLREGWLV